MFSTYLKQLRSKKGVTQTQLAAAIGVSAGNVGDWERDRAKPGFDAIISLSRFFEISADDLLFHDLNKIQADESLTNENHLSISDAEYGLVQMYRALDERDREDAFDNIKMKYDRANQKGSGRSLFSTYTEETATEFVPNNNTKGTA
jgi:transcriptional regulator with XRE-family HTH domain